jgi:surfeit locus 1 family protein
LVPGQARTIAEIVASSQAVSKIILPDTLPAVSLRDDLDRLPDGAAAEIDDDVAVTGLARNADSQGPFIPDNELAENRWFWRDLGAMSKSMFPAGAPDIAPFILEAERSDIPGGWPLGGQTRLDLPNNHLQYALTWFLLALCLVVIYVIYVRSRLRAA